jgi:hypothetical protein
LTSEEAAASRRALVVENDQFFTGDLVGEEPLSKNIDGSDRLVLEMLTPEQATQKLRQNEESFNVGRGRGVVRYDVVQLASNNPIEDDHAEKIIQVPENAGPGASACDWMFWGVFDGHRYVYYRFISVQADLLAVVGSHPQSCGRHSSPMLLESLMGSTRAKVQQQNSSFLLRKP